jgi:hypothetical protein
MKESLTGRCHPGFHNILERFDPLQVETHASSVYGMWKDFTLAYVNPAWMEFARDNNGEPQISREWNLGRNMMDAVSSPLQRFFENFFHDSLRTEGDQMHPRQLVYECSSDRVFRQFQMTVYPVPRQEGWLVVNALLRESPHSLTLQRTHKLLDWEYVDSNGIIHQCAHCRKTKHVREANRWDWIPEWVKTVPSGTSHDLCHFCLEYFYPSDKD